MEALKIWFDKENIFVETTDKKIGQLPLKGFKKLKNASEKQLLQFELWDSNRWIHWEALGEDFSVAGFFDFKKEKM